MKSTRKMTEIAVTVAMAVVCSFIKIFEMPQGGSVALTMIPILFIAFKSGAVSGIASGMIYGIISLAISGVVYHPMSILLDYVLAFGLLGIAGFFGKSIKGIITGSIIGVAGRFASSVISGAVLFASFAPDGQNPWIYSLIYQSTYMIPELVLSLIILIILRLNSKRLFGSL